jgi:hypothetical protein
MRQDKCAKQGDKNRHNTYSLLFHLITLIRLLKYMTMGTGGPFPGGKDRPGRDADHSPLSSAEVVNE